jgi:ubiquinone/menaquinone biosynthesis C-methylase UbiE
MSLNFPAIDEFLKSLESARDDDELRRLFETYNAEYDLELPQDPYGDEYQRTQFSLYEKLYGKAYSTSHEHSEFDVATAAREPFPYLHGSWSTVGNQLIAIGFIIKAMELPKGARILEFGPGWGNTTLTLAKMGYHVTAIDIEPNFVELIKERARMESIRNLDVLIGDFSAIESMPGQYDAILFFECFHHCSDHLRLIRALDRVVKPGGIVCFGAEPIIPEFPIPWGLRMDGQSLWAIRKNGWLELGFNLSYFEEAMRKSGWGIERNIGHDSPWATALIARRLHEAKERWDYRDGALRFLVGTINGTKISSNGRAGYLMYGPYVPLQAGAYVAHVHVANSQARGCIVVDVAAEIGHRILARKVVTLGPDQGEIVLPFAIDSRVADVEVRVLCELDTEVTLEGASINKAGELEATENTTLTQRLKSLFSGRS